MRKINEGEKFSFSFSEWWNESGKMKMLHKINPIRTNYIIEKINSCFHQNENSSIKILDVGCGCGILTESLAKSGFNLTGIDLREENIKIAKEHSASQNLKIEYFTKNEYVNDTSNKFDAVILSEVLEHIENMNEFLEEIFSYANENAIVFCTTINRNLKSIIFAKYIAEYVIKIVPNGMHDWKKFLKPSEINHFIEKFGFKIFDIKGIYINPLNLSVKLSNDLDINYILSARR